MGAKVEVKGLNALQRFLLNLAPATKREIQRVTEATARLAEADAKRRAPVDTGKLRQSISFELVKNGFGFVLSASAPYAPYVEFGTGGLVEVPEGFEDIAGQAKGNGKRKVNLPARPFLIPAFLIAQDRYYAGVSEALDRLFR